MIDVLVDDSRRIAVPEHVRLHRSVHADRRCDQLIWPWRTTVEETILDLSDCETVAVLGRAFQRHLTGEATVLARLAERQGHRHRDLIVAALSDAAAGAESAMEIRYVRDVERAHGLPRGRRQSVTGPSPARLRLRDVAYHAQHVIVELDGRLGHDQARTESGTDGETETALAPGGSPSARSGRTSTSHRVASPSTSGPC